MAGSALAQLLESWEVGQRPLVPEVTVQPQHHGRGEIAVLEGIGQLKIEQVPHGEGKGA